MGAGRPYKLKPEYKPKQVKFVLPDEESAITSIKQLVNRWLMENNYLADKVKKSKI